MANAPAGYFGPLKPIVPGRPLLGSLVLVQWNDVGTFWGLVTWVERRNANYKGDVSIDILAVETMKKYSLAHTQIIKIIPPDKVYNALFGLINIH